MGEEGIAKVALMILVTLFVKFLCIDSLKYFTKLSYDGRISNIVKGVKGGIKTT